MPLRVIRVLLLLFSIGAAAALGYSFGGEGVVKSSGGTVAAPPANSVRVIYSLDEKQNDKEIIALIDGAQSSIYFAMYEFTLTDIADALVAAKNRGVDVRGIVDSGESANSADKPIIAELVAANIPVETEKHADGSGIMHIKAIVTDRAYALGSYNWTNSATTENDELLEIGTDPTLRQTYEDILKRLFKTYSGTRAGTGDSRQVSIGTIDYTEAPAHIGAYASVRGVLVQAYTAKSGTVFLDFCAQYKNCPFSGVIFGSDVSKFGDLSKLEGQAVTVSGTISSYQGQAEIVLSNPNQLSR